MALAAALVAGGMSSVWLNATETEVYAASLLLAMLMIWSAERAGRDEGERWTYLTVYLMALAVPLHLSALVVAPVTMLLAGYTPGGMIRWQRVLLLFGAFALAMGIGKMSVPLVIAGAVLMAMSSVLRHRTSYVQRQDASFVQREHATANAHSITHADAARITHPDAWRMTLADGGRTTLGRALAGVSVAGLAFSALLVLYARAQFDPGVNQGNPATWHDLADVIARRQYAVSPMWPREAPVWIQLANFGQYMDWQVALSLGPTVLPSILRTAGTVLFLTLGYEGALTLWRTDRRVAVAILALFLCGSLGVLVYLNLHAGPSLGYGILPANAVREARERDYFFVFAFWAWGIWAGVGAISMVRRLHRPDWAGVMLACLPIALNWRAVTRRGEPEQSLPHVVAEAFLESAPRNAVLFVMGDNDSYPLWYAQQVLRMRRDVAVVTVPLLPTEWYRAELSRRHFLLTEKQIEEFEGKLASARMTADGARRLGRPVVAAITMRPREAGCALDRLRLRVRGWTRPHRYQFGQTDCRMGGAACTESRGTPRDRSGQQLLPKSARLSRAVRARRRDRRRFSP